MEVRNQKLIDAIVKKAQQDFPGALAMIGIYGSFLTGDIHEKSDLDLLILINDERGYGLSRTFIQEDLGVGHDLYCTTWEMLESDAEFRHPHISKLMDSRIVYCFDESAYTRLETLRQQAMSADTREAAEKALAEAERYFAKAILAESIYAARSHVGNMIRSSLDAIALLNKRYFHLGVRRVFEEIDRMERKPEHLRSLVEDILIAEDIPSSHSALSALMRSVQALFDSPLPEPQIFPGTYEEMFSNWRNKMYLAAETNDCFLSFDAMCGLDAMLKDLGFDWDVLDGYNSSDLMASARAYDAVLERYRKEYEKAGIELQSYQDIDEFLSEHFKKETA